jgi:hypothetical protein
VAISQQVGLVAQLKHIVSELSSRRPAAQKTMLLQAMLAENGAPVATLCPLARWRAGICAAVSAALQDCAQAIPAASSAAGLVCMCATMPPAQAVSGTDAAQRPSPALATPQHLSASVQGHAATWESCGCRVRWTQPSSCTASSPPPAPFSSRRWRPSSSSSTWQVPLLQCMLAHPSTLMEWFLGLRC